MDAPSASAANSDQNAARRRVGQSGAKLIITLTSALSLLTSGCQPPPAAINTLPELPGTSGRAAPRVNGKVGAPEYGDINDDLADTSVVEGNRGTTNAVFNVSVYPPSSQTIGFYYYTIDGSATQSVSTAAVNAITAATENYVFNVPIQGDPKSVQNPSSDVYTSGQVTVQCGGFSVVVST